MKRWVGGERAKKDGRIRAGKVRETKQWGKETIKVWFHTQVTALRDLWDITSMIVGIGKAREDEWWLCDPVILTYGLYIAMLYVCVCVLPSFSGSTVIATLSLPLPRLTRWGVAVWTFSPFPVSIRSRGGDYNIFTDKQVHCSFL